MLVTFFLALGAFTLLYVALLRARYRYATARDHALVAAGERDR